MDKENMVYRHFGVLVIHKEKQNYIICRKMDGTENHYVKQNKPDSEKQVSHIFSHMQSLT
jgi:ATP-dependent RNA circularization protein (DNA/RNA ligase family)